MKTEVVDLETAKRLKAEGFHKPCEHFFQDIDLPYSKRGLKRTKNCELLDHNKFDEFIYSAPRAYAAVDFLLGKNIQYESTKIIRIPGTKLI